MTEHTKFGVHYEVIPKDFLLAALIAASIAMGDFILRYLAG
ncbi:hypothetical protein BMS3Abin16_01555 [archaeon BMS3Abin16]|nr:hypothetical protein BMS3Abin16_01555 [archaeon BMS3Abin16]GBE56115.1 hypothetical protein BMS3Bbin16_00314 [archaeon BMS3Bbin16]